MTTPSPAPLTPPPALVRRLVRSIEHFLRVESSSGALLLGASLAALGWANSPWGASYGHVMHLPLGLSVGPWAARGDAHFVLNDGLMVLFFLVVGLEIRRELHEGELADARRAALPAVAALGGMAAPALLYLACNRGLPTARGWGVPTATDIAFAVGALGLLGARVPPALRVLLLALAIIDDIGAIVVLALFYSSSLSVGGLAGAGAGLGGVWLWRRLGVRSPLAYAVPGFVLWLGFLRAGIHPTLAGVVLGLLTPVRRGADGESIASRLQERLHPWVAFVLMPLFALANAGVDVRGVRLDAPGVGALMAGVGLGLVVGKPAGVLAASAVAVRTGLCALPAGVSWGGVAVVGVVAGVGFTMALFVAGLAFTDANEAGAARLAVLVASTASGLLAMLAGRLALPAAPAAGTAASEAEAESSTER